MISSAAVVTDRQKLEVVMKATCLIALVCLSAAAWAQPPAVEWSVLTGGPGDDGWFEVRQTAQGDYILGGAKTVDSASGEMDWWLMKLSATGTSLWDHTYGTASPDVSLSLAETSASGYLLCGYGNGMFENAITMTTNATGDSIGGRIYDGIGMNGFTSVKRTTDGGYILSGFKGTSANARDFWLFKLNSAGDSVWSHTYGGPDDEWCGDVVQTADGGYALAGETHSYGAGNYDAWLVRTDALGGVLWDRSYGGAQHDGATQLLPTADGGFILAGESASFNGHNGNMDFWLLKVNANGDSVWSHTYDKSVSDGCHAFCAAPGGGYLLVGGADAVDTLAHTEAWLVRTNENGDSLWSVAYPGYQHAEIWSVQSTADGGYILSGEMDTPEDTLDDAWALKLAPDLTAQVSPQEHGQPERFVLSQNYPNPFNPSTTIPFTISQTTTVTVQVFNVQGRIVETLAHEVMSAGEHRLVFDGAERPSGLYFTRVTAGGVTQTAKMILLK
jgi:hypothetical protein